MRRARRTHCGCQTLAAARWTSLFGAGMGALAEQGRLKGFDQLRPQRFELLENVATASKRKDLKHLSHSIWRGLMVPKNTLDHVVQRLHQAIGGTPATVF